MPCELRRVWFCLFISFGLFRHLSMLMFLLLSKFYFCFHFVNVGCGFNRRCLPSLNRKRHIMMKDVKCPHDPPIERRLFHGTKSSNTDSICRDNFDWRLSGVHGTAYGIGMW